MIGLRVGRGYGSVVKILGSYSVGVVGAICVGVCGLHLIVVTVVVVLLFETLAAVRDSLLNIYIYFGILIEKLSFF